jgi:pimeloyl-ACP methyl ester carboxylesterase
VQSGWYKKAQWKHLERTTEFKQNLQIYSPAYHQPKYNIHNIHPAKMMQLHPDLNFHYEAIRALGTIPYGGADLSEVLEIMPKIQSGDFDSWYSEWFQLAERVLATIEETKESSYSPVTLRNVYFRASHYFFVADFFLHGDKADPRMVECNQLWRKYFDKAIALLPVPGKHANIPAGGFEMPAILFRAAEASASNPRPAIIIGGGFESNMEETYHAFGIAALERGYNILIYEGPGHRALVNQGRGFIPEWEKAVSPIVDYIFANKSDELSFIDTNNLGLIGMSMGGYLAARAAAFEPRLAAVMCIDGVYNMEDCLPNVFSEGVEAWNKGDAAEFDRLLDKAATTSTGRRWFRDDLKYTFCKDSAYEAFEVMAKMTIGNGVAERILMPAYIGNPEDDMFFEGQPKRVAEAIGGNATLRTFGTKLGAQLHCHSGALVYMNQDMLEWFAGVVGH